MTAMDPTPRMHYSGARHPITGDPVVRQDSAGFAAALGAIRHEYGLDHPGLLVLLPEAYGVPRANCEHLMALLRRARREPIDSARPIYAEAAAFAQELVFAMRAMDHVAKLVLQAAALGCLMRSGQHELAARSAASPWSGDREDEQALKAVLDGHRKRMQAAVQ